MEGKAQCTQEAVHSLELYGVPGQGTMLQCNVVQVRQLEVERNITKPGQTAKR